MSSKDLPKEGGSSKSETPTSAKETGHRRRISTRSIKRKKFDDEVVESSLTPSQPKIEKLIKAKANQHPPVTSSEIKTPATSSTPSSTTISASTPLTPLTTPPATPSSSTLSLPSLASIKTPAAASEVKQPISTAAQSVASSSPCVQTTVASTSAVTASTSATPPVSVPTQGLSPSERKRTKTKGRHRKNTKGPTAGSTKDLGRWKPQDDLLLINAVQQTCDLTSVYLGCKFTCRFTLREIQERWYALLYDPVLSKLAVEAMKQLHPDVVAQVNQRALFSRQEEKLLATIPSNNFQNCPPDADVFSRLLSENPSVFHPARTAKHIMNHWLLMKHYHLLPDQSVPPMPKGDHVLNFSDAEDLVNDEELTKPKDEVLEHELNIADRRNKKEMHYLENELPKWQSVVDSVTGVSPQEFDPQTLAVLRGRLVRYLMRSKEITLGRSTDKASVDVDLSLEGPAWKISRRQGVIKMKNNGDFYIANEGKRPIYIDGNPVMTGCKHRLSNNSVVEISCLRFIFLVNQDIVRHGNQYPRLPT